ncbi:hypothetical protein F5Y18DRAFT_419807 [Xylariaceae sp. FL1019]|nr:hypothetical protein F5Y18DRAFT_419807 [Xylariaceae sp. FL1019]
MAGLRVRDSDKGNPEVKRRRVRKGTRSCWECRRRKIRCQYASEEASICTGCESRDTNCVSQEFADEQTPTSERRITQRLGRVEEMLEKLVEKIMPESYTIGQSGQHEETPSAASADDDDDLSDPTEGSHPLSSPKPPIFGLLGPLREDAPISCNRPPLDVPTPAPSTTECPALSPKNAQISRTLHALFPPQQDMDAITSASQGAHFVVMFFQRYRDIVEGEMEPLPSINEIPPVTAHPAILARRLMQLAICLQQLHPRDSPKLMSRDSTTTMMAKILSTMADVVVYNDQLVGNIEGVETLTLVALYHANAGNLRKGWLILRRAISVAQLMGLDRCGARQVKSVESRSCPMKVTRMKTLWFRLNFTDRYLSLLLGLPAGTDDNTFLAHEDDDEIIDKLEKQHTIVTGAIIKRNSCKGDPAFSATQAIDFDLEQMARSAGALFWQPPVFDPFLDPKERMRVLSQLMLHMNHYNLLILLHLPYVLRDAKERRWDYSKETCVSSSRQLLRTFLLFRKFNNTSHACRHTDYGALTASMTLLLGHLDPKLRARDQASTNRREADRTLVIEVRDKLRAISNEHNDKLSREAASIITRLLPLLSPEQMMENGDHGTGVHCEVALESTPVRLDVPFLGTININAFLAPSTSPQASPVPPTVNEPTPVATSLNQGFENIASDTGYFHDPLPPTPAQCNNGYQTFGSCLTFPLGYESNNSVTDFNTVAPAMQFEWYQGQLARPELAADFDQWTFQGFDTAYFESLFSSGAENLFSPGAHAL